MRPGVGNMTSPGASQWSGGVDAHGHPIWTSLSAATPVLSWANHITYPQMTYDAPLPWGPFKFVARSRYLGASNGHHPGFPQHSPR